MQTDSIFNLEHPIPIDTLEQMKRIIGSEIQHFRATQKSLFDFSISTDFQVGCNFIKPVNLSFKINDKYDNWLIGSVPLGDNLIGHNMYSLNIKLTKKESTFKEWYSAEYSNKNINNNSITFRPQGVIESIDVFGIDKNILRKDDDTLEKKTIRIKANLDLLITFNTSDKHKIAVVGNGHNRGFAILVFNNYSLHSYKKWIDSKVNQWGEHLFNFKTKIE